MNSNQIAKFPVSSQVLPRALVSGTGRKLSWVGALCLVFGLSACSQSEAAGQQGAASAAKASFKVEVDGSGYHPNQLSAAAGAPVHLVVTRTSDEGCGQKIVFPTLNIEKDLPLDQPVSIDLTMPASGQVDFTCGMGMLRGKILVK